MNKIEGLRLKRNERKEGWIKENLPGHQASHSAWLEECNEYIFSFRALLSYLHSDGHVGEIMS